MLENALLHFFDSIENNNRIKQVKSSITFNIHKQNGKTFVFK